MMSWLPTVLKLAADLVTLAVGWLGVRWLTRSSTPKEDAHMLQQVYRLLRWDMWSAQNWFNMMPYRLAVVTSYELGIAQRNLNKLKARYERGEYKEDTIDPPSGSKSDTPTDGDTGADGLASGQ